MLDKKAFIPLDKEEKELEQFIQQGTYEELSIAEKEKQIRIAREASSKFFKKNKQINIRMSSYDLEQLKSKAYKEGLPYQTFISSQLHKLAEGRLVEKKS